MRTINYLFLFLLIIFSQYSKSQPCNTNPPCSTVVQATSPGGGIILQEDFSSSANWTTLGIPPTNGNLSITNGKLEYDNFSTRQNHRVAQKLPNTLNNSDVWRADVDVTIGGSQSSYSIRAFAITENCRALRGDCPANLGAPINNNSAIYVAVSDPISTPGNISAMVRGKLGSQMLGGSDRINLNFNTTYYFRVERISDDKVILSIYNNSSRLSSQHIAGSPVCYDLDEGVTNLNYIQYLTETQSGSASHLRTGNADIDNLTIYDNTIEENCLDCEVDASMTYQLNECQVEFTNTSTIGTGNTFMGSVINFDDGKYQEIGEPGTPNDNLLHSYSPAGDYSPCITTFSYYYDGESYICCSDQFCIEPTFFDDCPEPDESLYIEEGFPCEIDADLSYDVDPCSGQVSFTNNSAMPSGNHLTTIVDLGDGTSPFEIDLGEDFDHTFATGSYNVCITIMGYFMEPGGEVGCCQEEICIEIEVPFIICDEPGDPGEPGEPEGSSLTKNQIEIAPNPFKNNPQIQLLEGRNIIKVLSTKGKLVYEKSVSNTQTVSLKLSNLPSGVYILQVQNGNITETKKIIKQ